MKNTIALTLLTLVFVPRSTRAEDCPSSPPRPDAARRKLAETWFDRGKAAQVAGDAHESLRAYACSLKMLPHPFTAFNLGVAAERAQKPDLAGWAFRKYLELKPRASDRREIEVRIERLESRGKAAVVPEPRVEEPPPPMAREEASAAVESRAAEDEPEASPPPTVARRSRRPEPPPAEPGSTRRWLTWGAFGGGGLVLGAGIVSNVIARGKMSDCRVLYDEGAWEESRSACASGKSYANVSYALIGIGAAAAAAGVALVLTDGPHEKTVALAPTPSGGTITVAGRF